MERLHAQLRALKEIQQKTAHGWTWGFDEDSGTICAFKGAQIRPVFAAHPTTGTDDILSPDFRAEALFAVEAMNMLPKLIEALERVLGLAEELDVVAGRRRRAAHQARLAERYDLSEAHMQSVGRVRAIQQAFLKEIAEAFTNDPEPAATLADYYQGTISDVEAKTTRPDV